MPGETVFKQGEPGRAFYIIESGRVSVQVDGQERARLSTGEYFGEIALFRDTPRMASVMALEDSTLLELNGETFDRLTAASAEMKRAVERASSRRLLANERSKTNVNGRQSAPYA
jgi:CRP-like cAMP-binding protein